MSRVRVRHFACAFAAALIAVVGHAQVRVGVPTIRSAQGFRQLIENTRKLQVVLEMDRQVYFPGEDAELTIKVVNASPVPLEVLDPFSTRTGGVDVFIKDSMKSDTDPMRWRRLSIQPYSSLGWADYDAPAVWLPPSQARLRRCSMSDDTTRTEKSPQGRPTSTICGGFDTPEGEGEYQVRYSYGPVGKVDFSIVWPQFENWTQVWFEKKVHFQEHDAATGKAIGKPLTLGRAIRFAVLGYESNHIIVVSVNPKGGPPCERDSSGRLTGYVSRCFAPYRRIATSTVPITSLQATADSGENVTLTYTDQTGRTSKLKLNTKRELMQ